MQEILGAVKNLINIYFWDIVVYTQTGLENSQSKYFHFTYPLQGETVRIRRWLTTKKDGISQLEYQSAMFTALFP